MGNSDEELLARATQVGERLTASGTMLATAESCTGGWLSKVITDVAGSSEWFERGFVTYSDAAKREMLGVSPKTLEAHGAVSKLVAVEMARGAVAHRRAQVSVAITGIAGPGGGSEDKPVGTVWLAWYRFGGRIATHQSFFDGDRDDVRRAAVFAALDGMVEFLQ